METRRRTTITQRIDEEIVSPGQALLFEQYRIVRRTWYWVLLAAILVTVGVYFYVSEYVEPEFLAVTELVPPRKTSTPLDNLLGDVASGLKSMSISKIIGRKGDESGYSAFSILSSTPILDSLIEEYDLYTVYDVPRDRPDLMTGALSENIVFESEMEGPMFVSVYDRDPERAARMANDAVRFANNLLYDLNRRETEPITTFISQRYGELKEEQSDLSRRLEAVMQKTNIYEPESQITASSGALIEARVEESTQRAALEVLERLVGADDPQVVEQRALLSASIAERKRLERGGAGIGPSVDRMPAALMEYARVRQDYEVNSQMMALVEPMYEQSLYDESRKITQLLVLREAVPPPIKARPSRGLAVVSAFLGTIILSYLVIALLAFFRSFSRRFQTYREISEGPLDRPVDRIDISDAASSPEVERRESGAGE